MGAKSAIAIGIGLLSLSAAAAQSPATGSALFEFSGTVGPIYGLAWSADGSRLSSVGHQQINIWRRGTDRAVATAAAHAGFVRAVHFSPDGLSLASAGQDGTVRIWSVEPLRESAVFETGPARDVEWSRDGRQLAIGGETGHFQIWHVADGRRVQSAWVGATISSVSWSRDGRQVAVGAINGNASLWNSATGRLERVLRVSGLSRNDVNGVVWSPAGGVLATAQGARGAGDIRLWDPTRGTLIQTLTGGSGWLRALDWSRDGQWIAAGGEDGNVRIWNVETGAIAATQDVAADPIWSLQWSPDGESIAVGTGRFDSSASAGRLVLWATPVSVRPIGAATIRTREIEKALVERGRTAPPATTRPLRTQAVIVDGSATGIVLGPDPPFGNLETNVVAADLAALNITLGTRFDVQCREKAFRAAFGTSWADVASGDWAGFLSLDGTLVLARNNASAAAASGCVAGDSIVVRK